MRFAKIGEEVFERQAELLCEEFRLYSLIVFHSYPDDDGVRLCRRTIEELCQIYGLDYDNTSRRFKRLRTGKFSAKEKPKKVAKMISPWIKKTTNGWIPLVGFKTVNNTVFEDELTVKITDKTVKITDLDCKNYSKTDEKTVKITDSFIPYIETFKEPKVLEHTQNKNGVRVDEKTNGHKSEFSIEEIHTYIEICQKRGDKIYNPTGLAIKLYQSGDSDAFIKAELYPDNLVQETLLDSDGLPILDEKGRNKALEFLLDVINDGFDLDDYQKYYRGEDWQWLMKQLKKSATNY